MDLRTRKRYFRNKLARLPVRGLGDVKASLVADVIGSIIKCAFHFWRRPVLEPMVGSVAAIANGICIIMQATKHPRSNTVCTSSSGCLLAKISP